MQRVDDDAGRIAADAEVARAVYRAKLELEQMIDLTPQVMLLLDEAGTIGRANLACLRLLGMTDFREVLGQPLKAFFDVRDTAFFADLLRGKRQYAMQETSAVLRGGREGVFRFTRVGLGEVSEASVMIIEDITEARQRAAREEKEHKKDAVKALAGALMHSINQRLTVITVRARLMLMTLDKGDVRPDDLKDSLGDIMTLTMEVAGILDRLDDQQDFVTKEYLAGIDILDLDRSSGKRG